MWVGRETGGAVATLSGNDGQSGTQRQARSGESALLVLSQPRATQSRTWGKM
jgi:hypothetical protein